MAGQGATRQVASKIAGMDNFHTNRGLDSNAEWCKHQTGHPQVEQSEFQPV